MTWPQYLRRECRIGEFVIKLSPQETEVLSTLLMRYPDSLTVTELIEAVWPDADHEPDYAVALIGQHIWHLRQKLGFFRIGSCRGFGYHLVQSPKDMVKTSKRYRGEELRWAA
jgi:DNA-binding response OmpR family regulator